MINQGLLLSLAQAVKLHADLQKYNYNDQNIPGMPTWLHIQNLGIPLSVIFVVGILVIISGYFFIKKHNERDVDPNIEGDDLPCCKASYSDLSETSAVICLILNFFYPGGGTCVSGFIDKKGCNVRAFWTGVLQALLTPLFLIGYVWGIWHMWLILRSIRNAEKPKKMAEDQENGTGKEEQANLIN